MFDAFTHLTHQVKNNFFSERTKYINRYQKHYPLEIYKSYHTDLGCTKKKNKIGNNKYL